MGPRISEAARLQVQDVDLDSGVLRLEKNETNDPGVRALSPGVAPALRAWLALRSNPAPSAPLFVNEDGDRFSVEHAAERFGAHLQLAGIDRPELFEDSDERQQVRTHDARSTIITVALANGRSETWIDDRAGRRSSVRRQRYRRAARTFAELGLGELASLAEGIPELGGGGGTTGSGTEQGADGMAIPKIKANSITWPRGEMADAVDLKGGLGRGDGGEVGKLPGKSEGGGDGSTRLERGCDDSEGARGDSIGGSGAGGERFGEGTWARAASVRATLLVQLGDGLRAAIVAGDVEMARVAHEAIGQLLGGPTPPQDEAAAEALDLDRERESGDGEAGAATRGFSRRRAGACIPQRPRRDGATSRRCHGSRWAWTPARPTALATSAAEPVTQ
ncbi:tyrosine-type recombinase/integrase [Sorangium sp. So ce176]|uniref:tyrosine-type recombinase/integrase n=1 Tax=Sorangium sp. So ce176 TaxID=3133286 RepID=UPI003F5D7CF7